VNESWEEVKYEDTTLGSVVSEHPVNYSKDNADVFFPAKKMKEDLAELVGRPVYSYRAFELLVTLDLGVYKAKRRLIVPADIEFDKLHRVLQEVFNWRDCHLHEFSVYEKNSRTPVARLVMSEEDFSFDFYGDDGDAILETDRRLSEYFPRYPRIVYTYDMGDYWEHTIKLVREIEEHSEESPFLLDATGQTPPEDVGGVPGFIGFREIMLDPEHPDHAEMKSWVGYWSPELREWDTKPKVIQCW
jgi:hypothetical protein